MTYSCQESHTSQLDFYNEKMEAQWDVISTMLHPVYQIS